MNSWPVKRVVRHCIDVRSCGDGDAFVVDTDNAGVGDGDAEHVAGEIAEHGVIAFAPGSTVHDPGFPPRNFRQDQIRDGALRARP